MAIELEGFENRRVTAAEDGVHTIVFSGGAGSNVGLSLSPTGSYEATIGRLGG